VRSYIYAVQIGENVKIGFTYNLGARLSTLRSQYKCAAPLLGVIPTESVREERAFHRKHQMHAVASEVYPGGSPPVTEFLSRSVAYVPMKNERWPHIPHKWASPYPPNYVG
jgi:hypothetical protein